MRRGRLVGILLRAKALLHAVHAASATRRAPWAPMRSTSSSPVGSNKVPRRSGITAGRSVPAARTPPGRGTRRQLILHPSARAQPEVVDLGFCGALSSPPRRDLSPLLPTPASTTGGVASYGNSDRSSARGCKKENKRYAPEILAAHNPSDASQATRGGRYFIYRPPRAVLEMPSAPGVGLPVATAHPVDIVGAAAQSWPPPRPQQTCCCTRGHVCWPMEGRRRPGRLLLGRCVCEQQAAVCGGGVLEWPRQPPSTHCPSADCWW